MGAGVEKECDYITVIADDGKHKVLATIEGTPDVTYYYVVTFFYKKSNFGRFFVFQTPKHKFLWRKMALGESTDFLRFT
mgnify:CR=1 FL=1